MSETKEEVEEEFEFMSEELDSFQILGVDPKDNLAQINIVYRQLLLIFHPDKYNTVDSQRLGLSNEEKEKTFLIIQKAYKDILQQKKETDAPDYDIKYNIDDDLFLASTDLEKINEKRQKHYIMLNQIVNHKYNSNVKEEVEEAKEAEEAEEDVEIINKRFKTELLLFNKSFEERHATKQEEKEKEKEPEFASEFKVGYGESFETEQRQEEHKYIKQNKKRFDIDVPINTQLHKRDLENESMILHSFYAENKNNNNKNNIGYMELGITVLGTFSCEHGSDLSEVYGQNEENYENYEDSYKRKNKIIDNEKDKIKSLDDLIKEREQLYVRDPVLDAKLNEEEKIIANIESARQITLKKQMDNIKNIMDAGY